jgi:hypothetical protein
VDAAAAKAVAFKNFMGSLPGRIFFRNSEWGD